MTWMGPECKYCVVGWDISACFGFKNLVIYWSNVLMQFSKTLKFRFSLTLIKTDAAQSLKLFKSKTSSQYNLRSKHF